MPDTGLDIGSLQAPISPALEPNQQVAAVGPIPSPTCSFPVDTSVQNNL